MRFVKWQSAQKRSRKFCGSKEDKNGETHPEMPEKGETGCVLGAGGDGGGWRRMKPGEKTRKRLGGGGSLHHNMTKMEGRTCLACRLGCCSPVGSVQHRPRREPRPAPRQSATGARSPLDTLRAPRLRPQSLRKKRDKQTLVSLFCVFFPKMMRSAKRKAKKPDFMRLFLDFSF